MKRRCADAPKCKRLNIVGTVKGKGKLKRHWGNFIRQDLTQLHINKDMILDKGGGGGRVLG